MSTESLNATDVNLTNCEREPIHIPDSIQPHGFLLGARFGDNDALTVVLASQSASAFLQTDVHDILGKDLLSLLPAGLHSALAGATSSREFRLDQARFVGVASLPPSANNATEFQVIGHHTADTYVLEFEQTVRSVAEGELNSVITNFVAALEQKTSIEEICNMICPQVRQLTGFDRVMLYRFDEAGHGTVLAEDRNDKLPSYLGLRFPGSDIPSQARVLYLSNRIRIIPDVEYEPSTLVYDRTLLSARPVDLSLSTLRSVSPIHRDYMRNMGTAASMSVSIVIDGKLWGLISAHHRAPRQVAYLVRSACDVLSRIMGAQISSLEKAFSLAHTVKLKSVQSQLLTYMATGESYIDGLVRHPAELCAIAEADGAAVIVGDKCVCLGNAPAESDVLKLSSFLTPSLREELFVTNEIGSVYPSPDSLHYAASGVLAVALSQVHRMQIMWFRPEIIESVNWAGEPKKQQEIVDGVLQVHPRNSFASWKQIVRGKSQAWSQVEIDSARDFRTTVLEIILKKAEELADLASELAITNQELEAFSYSVSHDLRAPFRHISGFAELLMKDKNQGLDEKGRRYLMTIAESAQFAGLLVDSLLNFSRITRSKLQSQAVSMEALADKVWSEVTNEELGGRVVVFVKGGLPTILTDATLMHQVLRNLFSNAAKYTRTRDEATVTFSAMEDNQEILFSVADNGVGFDGRYAHKLFGAFQRLHRMEDFEGTGIGLANVRRIISRMGGRTWAEGVEGQGATFFFTLPLKSKE